VACAHAPAADKTGEGQGKRTPSADSYISALFAGIGLWTAIGVTLVAGPMRLGAFGSAC